MNESPRRVISLAMADPRNQLRTSLSNECYLPFRQFFALQAFKKHARGPPFFPQVPAGQ
jgi:hypothetical protein